MTFRFYALTGLAVTCIAAVLAAQGPRFDNLHVPSLATPNFSQAVPKPPKVELKVPSGFTVTLYAENLPGARWMTWAPGGDLFVSQYNRSTIMVHRDTDGDGKADKISGITVSNNGMTLEIKFAKVFCPAAEAGTGFSSTLAAMRANAALIATTSTNSGWLLIQRSSRAKPSSYPGTIFQPG